MKLLLTSQGFEKNIKIGKELLKLVNKKASEIKVFLVTTADKKDQDWQWVEFTVKQLEKIGIISKNISIFSLDRKIKNKELKNIDIVYVCGGNTFLYLNGLRKTGLDKEIKRFVKKRGVYFGVSAGSCVASPTIEVASWEPADENTIGLKNLRALNIVPFFVSPHFEKKDYSVIKKSANKIKKTVIAINDKQAVLVENKDIKIIGIGKKIIFNAPHNSSDSEKNQYYPLDSWNLIYKKGKKNYQYYNFTQPHKDMPKIVRIFNQNKVKRVLDLGCGAGRNLLYLAKKGFEVHGIDIAKEGIEITKKHSRKENLKVKLKIGNVFKELPYKNDFFDAVISVQVLQHGKISQINKAIKEIERILKPGGFIFITLCGRYSKGKTRYCIVKTAKKIALRTYLPTIGDEIRTPHYIYNKNTIQKHYKNFQIIDLWRDDKDYYCFLGKIKKIK